MMRFWGGMCVCHSDVRWITGVVFFLLNKKLLEQFTSTEMVLPHEHGPLNMEEIEILDLQISINTCTCRSAIKINDIVYRMSMLMNSCEIKHDG